MLIRARGKTLSQAVKENGYKMTIHRLREWAFIIENMYIVKHNRAQTVEETKANAGRGLFVRKELRTELSGGALV